eukprot:SAG31_NODE_1457_length_8260_cov_2.805416_2_plen_475_part_00
MRKSNFTLNETGESTLSQVGSERETTVAEKKTYQIATLCGATELAPRDMDELKRIFRAYDRDSTGLRSEDFVDLFDSVAMTDSKSALGILFRKMDADASGKLGCDEFLSYLLHRSTQHEQAVRPTLLGEVGAMVESDDEDVASDANDMAPIRSDSSHGCMIKKCIAVPLTEGNFPGQKLYVTIGRPGLRLPEPAGPEGAVILWRTDEPISKHRELPQSLLKPMPEKGVRSDDAVSFLHRNHKTRDAMTETFDVDAKKEQGRASLLEHTSRVVDVTNWPKAQSVAVLVDNALLGSYLSVHRYKDLVGSHAAKIQRIRLSVTVDADGRRHSPTCLHLCPTHSLDGLCSGCFLVGDAGGGVGIYGPDGELRRHSTWSHSAVTAVALLPTRRGQLYRVACIGSDDGARCVVMRATTRYSVPTEEHSHAQMSLNHPHMANLSLILIFCATQASARRSSSMEEAATVRAGKAWYAWVSSL